MAEPVDQESEREPAPAPRKRRPATAREAKALGHPLRLRILRLCLTRELTNRELADRLDTNPGTVLHHVRTLVNAGLLTAAPVRTGASGALEKPYRATDESWWLDGPLQDLPPEERTSPITALTDELDEAGPEAVRTYARFALHLNDEEVAELDRRILAVLDEYVATDDQRLDRPVHGGAFLLYRSPDA
ncbi:helix-turn-helix domain-containing protein [Nocardiopsis valliformis]|uniref:helix-turn-helix domain-containing protein n=1 Tax=Nocardiopsis valliformis TaxID=239974 RepID=UPI00034689B5|nr:helix-turn-helix domain-containing protein [Nocardiopsis valliformis]